MYWLKECTGEAIDIRDKLNRGTKLRNLILVAQLSALAAIFQSAGGLLPGVGFLISPLATAPTLIATILSLRYGLLAYGVTLFILLVLQPSELIIFPFTTGLLGLGLGIGFSMFRRRISIIIVGATFLWLGICTLLYAFHFPVLGPVVRSMVSLQNIFGIYIFSLVYSWLWTEASRLLFKRLQNIL